MATPQSTPDARVDEELVEHLFLLRRALADRTVSEEEATRIVKHFEEEVMPPAVEMTATFRAIGSLTRCEHGVYGYRFQRFVKQLWKRRPDNVIEFPAIEDPAADEPLPAA